MGNGLLEAKFVGN